MFVLVLLILVAGGGAAYWLYSRSDEGLRQMVLSQLKTMAPNLNVEIERAHFDMLNRVVIYGLTIRLSEDSDDHPLLEVPELTATLEPTQLTDFENLVIQKLVLVRPKVHLVRGPDGIWNWNQIALGTPQGFPIPDLDIDNASIMIEIKLPDNRIRKLPFRNFKLTSRPADAKRLLIQVDTLLEPAGPLNLEIQAAVDGSSWKVESRNAWRVPVNDELVRLLGDLDLSHQITEGVANAGKWIDDLKLAQAGFESETTQSSYSSNLLSRRNSATQEFGVHCVSDISFAVQKVDPEHPLKFKVLVAVSEGAIENKLLPFSLGDIKGNLYLDNRQVIVTDVHASHGASQISFNGDVIPGKPIRASVSLRGIELTKNLKSRLPEGLRRILNSTGLTGVCDADLTLTQEEGVWIKRADLRLTKGTVTHEKFPVTVREVAGTLHLENHVVKFDATGKYAGQTVEASGKIINPGPAQRADIVIASKNLPLDDESLAACPAPVLRAIEALNLTGRHDLLLKIHRNEGRGQKYEPELSEYIHDGYLCFNGFPFTVQRLSGRVRWKNDLVEFTDIKGIHDDAVLTAAGTFDRSQGPGRLKLAIDATDAEFDRSLEKALPATLRQVWEQFQPLGSFDIKTDITWSPGSPCEVVVPSIKVRDGEVLMKCFSWVLHDLNGEFSYNTKPGMLVIKSVSARHDDTDLSVRGVGWFPNMKPWRLQFEQMNVDNLVPNATFRNALPEALQRTFDFLRPTGTFWISGPVEFSGQPNIHSSINASWKLKTIWSGCAIDAGSRIDDIRGVVQLDGSWDGTSANLDGDLNLDSASIFRQARGSAYQIERIRGPISFHDGKFVAGYEKAIPPRPSDTLPTEKRIRGDVIGGKVFLDAVVDLGPEINYRAFAELTDGRLERYAQQYLRGQSKLAGVMNGWINVEGKGTKPDRMRGNGKLVIAPAALYELPLFAQIFALIQLQSPDKTAFDEAKLDFTLANSRFDFTSIEMQGDTLQMRGRGFVRFDGGMQLGFGLTRRQFIPNPFKSGNLIAVKVTGNVGDPKTEFVTFPELDDMLRQFLGPMYPRRMGGRGSIGQNESDRMR